MTLDRRKVLIYLRPDISASERFADAKIISSFPLILWRIILAVILLSPE